MLPELQTTPEVRWREDFYHGGAHDLMLALADLPEETGTVLALGHNPGWENAVRALTGQAERMATANAAMLEAQGKWKDLAEPMTWRLVAMVRPKDL